MTRRRHQNDEKEFGQLAFGEQASSINATLNNLENMMARHIHDPVGDLQN